MITCRGHLGAHIPPWRKQYLENNSVCNNDDGVIVLIVIVEPYDLDFDLNQE